MNNANYTRYDNVGNIIKQQAFSIDVKEGDRVRFVDNSFLDDCHVNNTGYRCNLYPAGTKMGHRAICGTVIRTDSVQQAFDSYANHGKPTADLPIVVHGDDGSIIYCSPINIIKFN